MSDRVTASENRAHMHYNFTCLSALTFQVRRFNLNSWLYLCSQSVDIKIFKVSSSYSEYFNQKFEILTEISVSNLECKCTQTCKIFHAYGPSRCPYVLCGTGSPKNDELILKYIGSKRVSFWNKTLNLLILYLLFVSTY